MPESANNMNHAVKSRRVLAGALLMAIALDGAALNLGRAKGVVWIGRPLDVTIPISVDLGGDASAVCATADVFHADNQRDD